MRSNKDIGERVKNEANYLIQTKGTLRQVAKEFDISKSTVHIDVTERLKKIDPELYRKVSKILKVNKAERHIRGGFATREKWNKLNVKGN